MRCKCIARPVMRIEHLPGGGQIHRCPECPAKVTLQSTWCTEDALAAIEAPERPSPRELAGKRGKHTYASRPCRCCGATFDPLSGTMRDCATCIELIPKVLRDNKGRQPTYSYRRGAKFYAIRVAQLAAEAAA